ncbi:MULTISPECIES: 50S ribosomal protein L23 [Dyadobacter]|jgi:large subunit ribosomal protein L23|uniref:Large ribosomal subunit protein uL23 n=7 Tax=Dyadobacter TaxID=120831 RepID=C6W1X2_DYAFD|nr:MULTISPECIES: 50S ribosomal protein L23 [Dyadobacter]ACT95547.1 Ribosomal protein L25/L23 [Dyadobacter fermentans DSM 18053]MBO9615285.1 50S ribosomal protein L23 [Dyadobacter sp.]MBZ1358626.1 50S ribosomal protein L23 [Dyadobacter fermentans]MDR6803301.1 large subunit ribosomal protein L23 [Dyadobacter fermentans]MDR7041042.1 large subunit ribosomal protein L23 [Dyadobacter sp. BE242]
MSVLKRPIITEKVTAQGGQGKYAFEVSLTANKVEIKKAVEKLFGVTVESVHTMRSIGKSKSRTSGGKFVTGKTSTIKKAIITVAEGEAIDIYGEA